MWLNAAAVPDVLWLPSSTRVKRTLVQGGVRIRQIAPGSPIKKKNPESRMASGFFGFLTLAELRRATCGFETVLWRRAADGQDHLQRVQSKIIIDVAAVNGDLAPLPPWIQMRTLAMEDLRLPVPY
jgi:hypothetical protein